MAIKLIVSDVDGTLLAHDQILSQQNINTIKEARNRGIMVTIGSGRSYSAAAQVHKLTNMNGPIVSLNGAIVKDPVVTYCNHCVDNSLLVPAYEFSLEYNVELHLFSNETIHFISTGDKVLEEKHRKSFALFGNRKRNMVIIQQDEFLQTAQTMAINKLIFISDHRERISIVRQAYESLAQKEGFSNRFGIMSSYWNNFELMPFGVNKGTGVAAIAKAFNFKRDEILCIGDNENDISMFNQCDFSIAMGNANDMVKSHAKYTTATCEEHGVALAIEKYAL